jgi:hypothetical protein
MFYPFKPARSHKPPGPHFQKLQAKIMSIQREWANRLNNRAQRLPARKLKAVLIAAGLAATAAAAGLIYRGITAQKLTIHRFDLSLPALFASISVPESPAKQQALDWYLDSLEKAFIFDSIQNTKPTISHDSSRLH